MNLPRVNLRSALLREKAHQKVLIDEVLELLQIEEGKDKAIADRLKEGSNNSHTKVLLNKEEAHRIFHIENIRNVCLQYRLRFLDTSHFKAEYPHAAISEIKSFEKKFGNKIQSFRILAPSKAFELENINKDPLLFAQLDNKTFYLLHQWGHDLAWYRKILSWPLQNMKNLMLFLLAIGLVFAFSIPSSVMHIFSLQSEIYLRIWLAIHTFIGLLGFALWGGLSFNKNFSKHNWDSKYYNY